MRRGAVPCRRAFPLGFSLDAQTPYAVPTYDFLMEWHHRNPTAPGFQP